MIGMNAGGEYSGCNVVICCANSSVGGNDIVGSISLVVLLRVMDMIVALVFVVTVVLVEVGLVVLFRFSAFVISLNNAHLRDSSITMDFRDTMRFRR